MIEDIEDIAVPDDDALTSNVPDNDATTMALTSNVEAIAINNPAVSNCAVTPDNDDVTVNNPAVIPDINVVTTAIPLRTLFSPQWDHLKSLGVFFVVVRLETFRIMPISKV